MWNIESQVLVWLRISFFKIGYPFWFSKGKNSIPTIFSFCIWNVSFLVWNAKIRIFIVLTFCANFSLSRITAYLFRAYIIKKRGNSAALSNSLISKMSFHSVIVSFLTFKVGIGVLLFSFPLKSNSLYSCLQMHLVSHLLLTPFQCPLLCSVLLMYCVV